MNDKTIAQRSKLGADSATMFFGVKPDDPSVAPLKLAIGLVIQGDCRTLSSDDLGLGPFGRPPVSRAVCRLFADNSQPQNDAISVIEALISAGFSGEVIVLAPALLRPKMVENELRALARGRVLRLMPGVLPPLTEI